MVKSLFWRLNLFQVHRNDLRAQTKLNCKQSYSTLYSKKYCYWRSPLESARFCFFAQLKFIICCVYCSFWISTFYPHKSKNKDRKLSAHLFLQHVLNFMTRCYSSIFSKKHGTIKIVSSITHCSPSCTTPRNATDLRDFEIDNKTWKSGQVRIWRSTWKN